MIIVGVYDVGNTIIIVYLYRENYSVPRGDRAPPHWSFYIEKSVYEDEFDNLMESSDVKVNTIPLVLDKVGHVTVWVAKHRLLSFTFYYLLLLILFASHWLLNKTI